MKLRIRSGEKLCTTEEFKTESGTGSKRHTYLSTDSGLLGGCDGHEILNGKAEIKVVSADSNYVVLVSKWFFPSKPDNFDYFQNRQFLSYKFRLYWLQIWKKKYF